MQYKIIEADTREIMEKFINRRLGNGWKLHGGLSVGRVFMQAMTKQDIKSETKKG
jgi:hypothetical protein